MDMPQNSPKPIAKYVSEETYRENMENQPGLVTETLTDLKEYDITENTERKLEFYFYTDTIEKAEAFALELGMQYFDVAYGESDNNDDLFIVTGWTADMKMAAEEINTWAKGMCEIGYRFDCDFDGWGTNID